MRWASHRAWSFRFGMDKASYLTHMVSLDALSVLMRSMGQTIAPGPDPPTSLVPERSVSRMMMRCSLVFVPKGAGYSA